MADNPIFIIGTERSGTNLLRLILNAHSAIAVPHPPHILKNLFDLEPSYGDLKDDDRFRELIDDAVRVVELHPYPWGFAIDREAVFRDACRRDLLGVYLAIYDQYAAHAGKKRWACKSTHMIRHVALIRQACPGAKFLYMVRDGRDVAVSARETIFNRYSVYYAARLWKEEQDIGLYWLGKLSPDEIHRVRYEDLLRDPRGTVTGICRFLGVDFAPGMLEAHGSSEARKSASLSDAWRNTDQPILEGNSGRFREALTPEEISLYEAIASSELDRCGYGLCRPAQESESLRARGIPFRLRYWLEEVLRMLWVQWRYLFLDRSSLQRCKKFWFVQYLRLTRSWA
ncbi:MAG TPA: sulfotransferase [Elusimicrobia bacterium]|nr:sulfotransferase [Elusimicrobiota bacterium]